MLFGTHPRYEDSSNSSTGFAWKEFDFEMCDGKIEGTYIWGFFMSLSFAIGFPACVAVLWELFQTHKKGAPFTPNDIFMLNLTVMDLIFFVYIPPSLCNYFIMHNWLLEATWNLVFGLNVCGRPLLMACICLDCYLAVVHPIVYRARKSLIPRVLMAAGVWVVTIGFGIAGFFFYNLYQSPLSTVPYISSIITSGICDFFILQTLKRSEPGRKGIHPQKQRAIQTIINSLVMAVIAFLPTTLLTLIGRPLISDEATYICNFGVLIFITSTAGSTVMPLLYLHNLGKLDRFRFGCCKNCSSICATFSCQVM